jgi:hypothetical protein
VDETPYRLAYEASVRAIEDQARLLDDLRSRSATLVAAAALVTGFLGDATLTRADGLEPLSWAGVAIASFIATAIAAFVVLWPVAVGFRLSAAAILGVIDDRAAEGAPVSSTEALGETALQLELLCDRNEPRIQLLLWVFRSAILFLTIEAAAWTVALWRL